MPRIRSRREGGVLVIEVEKGGEPERRSHGGARRGAGRKPSGRRPGVAHRRRRDVRAGLPIHVSTRMVRAVSKVSRRRRYRVIRRALDHGSQRKGFRVCHFSITRSRVHLVIEADGPAQLHRGMTGLLVRLARGLNGEGKRRGQVFPDRYRHRIMSNPAQVHRTLSALVRPPVAASTVPSSFTAPQLLGTAGGRRGATSSRSSPGSGVQTGAGPGPDHHPSLAPPASYLLARAWRRYGPLDRLSGR